MKHSILLVAAASTLLFACGSSDEGAGPGTQGPSNTPSTADPCGLSSGFPGDEFCILPPDPSEGIQIHTGPPSYDAADAEPYVIQPGTENVLCYLARVPEGGFYYLRQENRMRSGSHHMLIGLVPDEGQPEGPVACTFSDRVGSISGSQTPRRDFPDELAPEDAGLARYLPAGAMAAFQMHYVNTGKVPLLREAWINLYRLDESAVKQRLQDVFLVADRGVNVPPQTRQSTTLTFEPSLSAPTRIFQLNAHMHAHTETFTVWRLRGEQRELVYKSFDWAEPDELTYNTVVDNPAPDDAAGTDGGSSGLLYIEPGDRLEWTCDVNNTTEEPLRFANEAYTAEMCLLAGSYVSDTPGLFAGICQNGACMGFQGR
jgi:hypothetical protein